MKSKKLVTVAVVAVLVLVIMCGGFWLFQNGNFLQRAAAQQDKGADQPEEGRPVLINVTKAWFADKAADPGLKLTDENIKGLRLATAEVVPAKTRPLPPQVGTLNYDNETMFLIKPRFAGELVTMLNVKDKIIDENGYEKEIERPIKFGDKVKQGTVLAVFWSVTLGTAKAAFVDAISALRLSQDTLDRQFELFKDGGLPLAALKVAERQVQGDNNTLLTAERTLRMWRMTDEEITALRKEANEMLDSLLINPTGRISKIDATGLTLLLSHEDKKGMTYKFAKDCKFFRTIKRYDKEEIKEGVKAAVFQNIGPKGLGAMIVTNNDGELTEVIIGKERDALDEVQRWAKTEVVVPWFDKAHPDRKVTVLEKNTNIGDFVDNTNFGTWLFRVADMTRLQIWAHPPEEFLPLIREGMKKNGGMTWEIRFQSEPDAPPHVLRIDRISPSLEPNQHNPMVVGYLPNKDHKYLAGQFVTVTINTPPEPNTLEIPTDALNELKGQSFVFVKAKDKPGEYFFRRVAVVRRYADFTIVRSELRDQDKQFSAEEVKQGRYPLRTLNRGDEVVTRGVVQLTTALENAITRESIKLQQQ
jgi:multidrug efflux pump subunit AcrA (membrane-fusion protein)